MAKKGAEEREEGEEMELGEGRVYELGFHLDPDLPSEEVKKAYQSIRSMIAEKGEVVAEGEPEKIALAYTISRQEVAGRRDFDSAYFAWIAYETPAESHAELVAAVAADKRVVRFIDLTTEKEAARHAAEREALALKAPEREPEGEPAAPAEVLSEDAALDAALASATI